MRDEVQPISGNANDWFGGYAATLVDSLGTLWIMDMKKEFEEGVNAMSRVDFSPGTSTEDTINVYETNSRHLGGLLGAYDLSGDKRLLDKAIEVADMIYAAFDTPNRMPLTRWRPTAATSGSPQRAEAEVLAAEMGSFSLEFTRLTQLTGGEF
jgi:mannosyl-oligosaccharide alpha-1,2-mannosidase